MERKIFAYLSNWYKQSDRKPLVLRGARQVGKTWLVRSLAEQHHLELLELNFESDSTLRNLFVQNNPKKVIQKMEVFFQRSIHVNHSLLFLDEIQAAPEIFSKLRWFAEEMPELPIIATGSLLDFMLEHYEYSVPVGRIQYAYLEPLSFEEFLWAMGEHKLYDFIVDYKLEEEMPEFIHERLRSLFRDYTLVGGLPAAVGHWAQNKSFITTSEVHQRLLMSYRDDFAKYAKRVPQAQLEEVFNAIPKLLGKKIKLSAINKDIRSVTLKSALDLLCKARICHKVHAATADGIPLGAGIKENVYKAIFLDVGLVSADLNLTLSDNTKIGESHLSHEGGLSEQLVGQLLRAAYPHYMDPKLYYWVREKAGAEAEIDYLIQHHTQIIPIEVKSGSTGVLRSLHTFMHHFKHLNKAVRINADVPSITPVDVKIHTGESVRYKLLSIPLYLTEQIRRLLEEMKD